MSNPFKKVGAFFSDVVHDIGRLGGNDPEGNFSGYGLAPSAKTAAKNEEKARAEAEAAAKQAEFEASARAGLERLALKKKKGFGASIIVDPTLGSTTALGS